MGIARNLRSAHFLICESLPPSGSMGDDGWEPKPAAIT